MKRETNIEKLERLMRDGQWRHRAQMERQANLTTAPETTLRLVRSLRERGYRVDLRPDENTDGLYWYRAVRENAADQGDLFAGSTPKKRAQSLTSAQKREAHRAVSSVVWRMPPPDRKAVKPLIDWLERGFAG